MKRFQFRLERILEERSKKEKNAIQDFAKIAGQVNAKRLEQDDNQKQIERSRIALSEILKKSPSMEQFLIYEDYIKQLYSRNDSLEDEIEAKNLELSEFRNRLIEARKNKKVLEILKERDLEAWKKKKKKEEKLEMEDYFQRALFDSEKTNLSFVDAISLQEADSEEDASMPKKKTEYEKLQEQVGLTEKMTKTS